MCLPVKTISLQQYQWNLESFTSPIICRALSMYKFKDETKVPPIDFLKKKCKFIHDHL